MRRFTPLFAAALTVVAATPARALPGPRLVELDREQRRALQRHQQWLRDEVARRGMRLEPRRIPIADDGRFKAQLAAKLELDPDQRTVAATAEFQFTGGSTPLGAIYMSLDTMTDGSPSARDDQGPLALTDLGQGVWELRLRNALHAGQTVNVVVEQQGTPDCTAGWGGIAPCQLQPGLSFTLTSWLPMFYDHLGNLPDNGGTSTIEVTVPEDQVVAANGIPAGVEHLPDVGKKVYRYQNGWEAYGFVISVGPFVGATKVDGELTIGSYMLPAGASLQQSWLEAMADVMRFHQERYGPYTPEKIDVAEVPDVAGAAFGPMLTIFMPSSSLRSDPSEWWARMTVAHELGHQWFGGFIAPGDNLSPWLSEGFATFAEMEYSGIKASADYGFDYRALDRWQRSQYYIYSVPRDRDAPISSRQVFEDQTVYFVLTYYKGALVVGMMRYLIGDEDLFFQALRTYREDHADTPATVQGLAASLQKATGVDFTRFFEKWAYGKGYPTYSVGMTRSEPSSGGFETEVTITADQDYALPVEIELWLSDGSKQRQRIEAQADGTTFEHRAQTSAEVVQLRFDPEMQIISRAKGALPGDVLFDGAADGRDLIAVAWAVGQQFDVYQQQRRFDAWADLVFDGTIDRSDLDVVRGSFGKRQGE